MFNPGTGSLPFRNPPKEPNMNSSYRPAFDVLERRDVPSAANPSVVNLSAGVLTVVGSQEADAIVITQVRGKIRVVDSGQLLQQVPATSVIKIVVDGDFGNDKIFVAAGITNPTSLYGGYGADALFGGGGRDLLFGGAGPDTLFGRGGADMLFGGSGNDTLDGGLGANTLFQEPVGFARQLSATEQLVADLVNQERLSQGLAPLVVNSTLNYAAWLHSNQMAVRSRAFSNNPAQAMQHTLLGVNAPTVGSRLDFAGYDNWQSFGENIAFGYPTAIEVMQGWMNSPGHRANILNPNVAEIGIGVVTNAQGYLFWTQEFGSR